MVAEPIYPDVPMPTSIIIEPVLPPTFRSYFWKIASEASLYCRDSHNLSLVKPLRKPLQIQTAECGLPPYSEIVMELMRSHGGELDSNEAFFPQGTLKRFLWPRIIDWRYVIVFPDGYKIGLIETRDRKNILSFPSHDLVCPTCKRPV